MQLIMNFMRIRNVYKVLDRRLKASDLSENQGIDSR